MKHYTNPNRRTDNPIIEALREYCFDNPQQLAINNDPNLVSGEAIDTIIEFLYWLPNIYYTRARLGEIIKVDVGLQKTTSKGRFTKRLSKVLHDTHHVDLTDAQVSHIGNQINIYSNAGSRTYFVDVIDKYDWSDGMFGKEGSCYWGCYSESRPTLEHGYTLCLRNYASMDDDQGIGRLWVVDHPTENAVVIFNAYGLSMQSNIDIIKAVVKLQTGQELSFIKSHVYNSHNDEIPYINDNSGYILYFSGDNEPDDSVDIDLDCFDAYGYPMGDNEDYFTCEHCNSRTHYDDGSLVGDYMYCDDCISELFAYCEKCGEYCDRDEVHRAADGDYLCERHLQEAGYVECENCEEWTDNYIHTDDTDCSYCWECAERLGVYECYKCEEWFENQPAYTDYRNNPYCTYCKDEIEADENQEAELDQEGITNPFDLFCDNVNFQASLANNLTFSIDDCNRLTLPMVDEVRTLDSYIMD